MNSRKLTKCMDPKLFITKKLYINEKYIALKIFFFLSNLNVIIEKLFTNENLIC